MIFGQVFAERPAVISAGVDSSAAEQGEFSEIWCTDYGTLSRETILRLGLEQVQTTQVVLANGSKAQVDVYRAEVLQNEQWRTVYVCESEDGADEGWHKFAG